MAHYSIALGQIHSQKAWHSRVKYRHANRVAIVHPSQDQGVEAASSVPPALAPCRSQGLQPAPALPLCSEVCKGNRGAGHWGGLSVLAALAVPAGAGGRQGLVGVCRGLCHHSKHTSSGWSRSFRCRS